MGGKWRLVGRAASVFKSESMFMSGSNRRPAAFCKIFAKVNQMLYLDEH